ncbi:MAG: hypothetical protein AB1656_12760 [Candidatus Omnitrophota bacterium]
MAGCASLEACSAPPQPMRLYRMKRYFICFYEKEPFPVTMKSENFRQDRSLPRNSLAQPVGRMAAECYTHPMNIMDKGVL